MNFKTFVASTSVFSVVIASAATLTVDLTVQHGIGCGDLGGVLQERTVAYFVIDRSGSMDDSSLENDQKPNDALLESLKLRLDALPDGATVFVLPFSTTVKSIERYSKLDGTVRRKIMDWAQNDKPKGMTLLYDAQDVALTEAARLVQNHPEYDVHVYVYTDGYPETPSTYEGEYPTRKQLKQKGLGRSKWIENPDYANELSAAKAKFEAKFAEFITKPNVDVEYEWLSREEKPDPKYKGRPSIPASLALIGKGDLQNPIAEPKQHVACRLFLPIIDKCWEEIKGRKMAVNFDVDGKAVSQVVELKDGVQQIGLDWPSLPEDKVGQARLSISRLPSGKKFDLNPPKAIEWRVPAQGKVSVSIRTPGAESVVAVGTKVRFEATASDQAQMEWQFGAARERHPGAIVELIAKPEGTLRYSVTASKAGLKSASAEGALEVIPTGVAISSATSRHEVGKASTFKASAKGPCQRFAWSVDGRRVPGETATLSHSFEKSGPHKVGVTAFYKAGITADAEALSVNVAAAPFLEIVAPVAYDGDIENAQFQAEKPIDYEARVEGDLTEVEWRSKLKGKVMATSPSIVKDGCARNKFTPPKGGCYEVVAIAKGPAGTVSSKPVQIFVKSAEVKVGIVNPTPNQDIDTGREFTMTAVVKGPVKNVRWQVVKESTGKEIKFGAVDTSAVVNERTEIKAKLPIEVGNARVKIMAEPVLADDEMSEELSFSSVTVDAKTFATIRYSDATQKKHWKRFPYGQQVALSVDVDGAIGEVQWYRIDNKGKEEKLPQTGRTVNVDLPALKEHRKDNFSFRAEGRMPDGRWIPADGEITLEVAMPELKAILKYDERGSYSAGGNIRIDGSASEGFPTNWVWRVNGVVQPQFNGKRVIDVDFPRHPDEMVVELAVAGASGVSIASTKTLKVRLLWLAIPATILLVAILLVLGKICFGNGPKHWSFYTWEGAAPKLIGGGYPEELGDAYLSGKAVELQGIKRWNFWTKKGRIRMGDMLMLDQIEGNAWAPFAEEEFEVRKASDGSPIVRPPEGKFDDVTAEVNLTGEAPYFLFRYIGLDYADEISNGHDNVRVRVVTDGASGVWGGLLFLAALGLSLWGFVWFCTEHAI